MHNHHLAKSHSNHCLWGSSIWKRGAYRVLTQRIGRGWRLQPSVPLLNFELLSGVHSGDTALRWGPWWSFPKGLAMTMGVLGGVLGTRAGSVCERESECMCQRACVWLAVWVCVTTGQTPGRYHLGYKGPKPTSPVSQHPMPSSYDALRRTQPHFWDIFARMLQLNLIMNKQAQMKRLSTKQLAITLQKVLKEIKTEACSKSKGPQETRPAGGAWGWVDGGQEKGEGHRAESHKACGLDNSFAPVLTLSFWSLYYGYAWC